MFEQDSEAFFTELQNQVNSLSKTKGKTDSQFITDKSKQKKLQKKLDALNDMVARLAPAAATAEVPVEQVAETTIENDANSQFEYYQGDIDSMVEESKATPQL